MKNTWFVLVVTGLMTIVLGCGGGGDPVLPVIDSDTGVGTLNISMEDFKFTPDRIDLVACQKIRVVLTNNSATNDHGFTIGYGRTNQGGPASGFDVDMLDAIDVAVTGPAKSVSSGNAILTRNGDEVSEDGAGGFMVVKAPSTQATIIEFTVPPQVGDFEFASFESGGKHYDDGMKGLIKVFPKDLPPKGWAGAWRSSPDKCASDS